MNHFLESALSYAKLGWRVFPLVPGQKIPITSHGVKDATVDETKIWEWWARWPTANIAVACGKGSGIWIVDVDIEKSTGVNGRISLKEFPELPKTVWQNTPRGGFHAFYRTNNPPRNAARFRPGIEIRGSGLYVVLSPSVHPNGGIYEWSPGCAPWELALSEFPDFMRPATRPPWIAGAETAQACPSAQLQPAEGDVLRRASAYLAECDPAIQGQSGHSKLLWAAGAMTWGCLLTEEQTYELLVKEYNSRCIPPWDLSLPQDEKDFRRKIIESIKHPPDKPKGWILNDPAYSLVDNIPVDVNNLLSQVAETVDAQDLKSCGDGPRAGSTPALATDAEFKFITRPTGLLGRICSWINETSLKEQPLLTLGCTIAFLGALFGRKIKDGMGARTNVYCMGVAPSSAGKAHAPNQIRRICEAAGCVYLLGGDTLASDSALEERMAKTPTTLFLWDEIGHLLSYIKSGVSKNHAQVVPVLMKLYSSAGSIYKGREYADEKNQRIITQPCCCIYGTSTPERLTAGFTREELQDGWLSRCLVFKSDSNPEKRRGISETEVPFEIVEIVKKWNDLSVFANNGHSLSNFVSREYYQALPGQSVIPTDALAERAFIALDKHCISISDDPIISCLLAKAEESARRIALIVAASESFDNPKITFSIADYSCRLILFLLRSFIGIENNQKIRNMSMLNMMANSEIECHKNKILSIIGNAGKEGCRKGDITRRTQYIGKKFRSDLLDDLLEAELIVRELVGKSHVYWTPENYLIMLSEKTRKIDDFQKSE